MGRVWPNPEDPAEPYWLKTDREKLYAYYLEKSDRCPKCNIRYDDYDKDPLAWQPLTRRCPGCESVQTEWEKWHEERGNTKGLNIHLARRDDPELIAAHQKRVAAGKEAEARKRAEKAQRRK